MRAEMADVCPSCRLRVATESDAAACATRGCTGGPTESCQVLCWSQQGGGCDGAPVWLDEPDAPGWWWHARESKVACCYVVRGGVQTGAWTDGQWCRALPPALPEGDR